jgi:hypothetical protein
MCLHVFLLFKGNLNIRLRYLRQKISNLYPDIPHVRWMLLFLRSIYLDKRLSLNFLVFESITAIPATSHLINQRCFGNILQPLQLRKRKINFHHFYYWKMDVIRLNM